MRIAVALGATVVAALALMSPVGVAQAADAPKPNIVFILTDDLGFGDIGCHGQKTLATPNIDRLADRGLRFTQHYAGSTVCAPSRCALLTGLHTGHCTVRGNHEVLLRDDDVTIPMLLKKAGYTSACVGKWGVGHPPALDDPNRMGFDHFFGYSNMFHAHNCYPAFLVRNGEKVALRNVVSDEWDLPGKEGRGVATTKVDYAPELIMDEALAFIEEEKDGPFFLYLAMNVPHANNEGGKHGMEVPSHGPFADEDWPEQEKGFAAMIRNIDNDVARIVEKLEQCGVADNTLVLFSSDNGPHQEGGHLADFFDSNGPLRGIKRDVYDGGVRTPMIAYWPGAVEPGTTTDHVSAFWDVLPTLCELAGVEAPADTDGISFVPTLLGDEASQPKHDYLYWEFKEKGGRQAVRLGDYKGVRMNTEKNPDGPLELYHLPTDIGEAKDIAAEHPELARRIEQIMREAHTPEK